MKIVSLILRILAIVGALAAAAVWFLTEGKLEEKAQEIDSLNSNLATQSSRADQLEQDKRSLEGNVSSLQTNLQSAQRREESIRQQFNLNRTELAEVQQNLRTRETEITQLQNESQRLRRELVQAQQVVVDTRAQQQEIETRDRRITELRTELRQAQSELEEARETIVALRETPTSGTTSVAGSAPRPGTSGTLGTPMATSTAPMAELADVAMVTVASVLSREGLVVLRLPVNLNVAPNTRLTLVRDGQTMGQVVTTRVQGQFAVAEVLPTANRISRLREGDTLNVF